MKEFFKSCSLVILDGWGETDFSTSNAVKIAKTPAIDFLYLNSFSCLLDASGKAVGLPESAIGNSEVGHLTIGSGRTIKQEVLIINEAIDDGSFYCNRAILNGIRNVKENKTKLHIIGLISDSLVHSSLSHLFAILSICSKENFTDVYIHAITDGRDTDEDSAFKYINEIENAINNYKVGAISTVSGRYYAMDRDERWERTEKAYVAMVKGSGNVKYEQSAHKGIKASYDSGITDEFIEPFRIQLDKSDKTSGLISDLDTVIFFNFRGDRARQLTESFTYPTFDKFLTVAKNTYFITMCDYKKDLCPNIVFPKEIYPEVLTEVISMNDFQTFKIAETEKYAHVTYFFNGERETPFPQESRYMIPSLKVPTYDLSPQMRADEITKELVKRIDSGVYKLLVANYANADMVGHTGNLKATIKACETIDDGIKKVIEATDKNDGLLIVTADHGNAEVKYSNNQISKMHTTNPVPFIFYSKRITPQHSSERGKLADIAPTILTALGLDRSYSMDGNILYY